MTDPWSYNRTVTYDDTRAKGAGSPHKCFYCKGLFGHEHEEDCVCLAISRLDAAPVGVWFPISTYRDGDFVLFWFPHGEKGNGGKETAMAYRDFDGRLTSGWSHGGPNSGLDFYFSEEPTMWCKLPEDP